MNALSLQLLGMNWMDPNWLLDQFGSALFWISLLIIFVECGLFFPFLPGDTLLFALGLFISTDKVSILSGHHSIDLVFALVLFTLGAVAGNVVGYEIGRKIGPPLAQREGRILKKQYFEQTHEFFEKHGSKALVIGRFVPFVRTYITVVAGITMMSRRRFFTWSAVGAVSWVLSVTLLGYFLGNVPKVGPFLSSNIDFAIMGLLLVSVIPLAYEWWKHRRHGGPPGERPAPTAVSSGSSDVEV
ncbi:membrane-associated protein [Marmoricola sp. URHA0025 HA25]